MKYTTQLQTQDKAAEIAEEIKYVGSGFYKGYEIEPSPILEGWFVTDKGGICGQSIEEVMFDIDDTQSAIDFDAIHGNGTPDKLMSVLIENWPKY